MTYIEAIGKGFPGVQCHTLGDGSTYESLVWDSGQPIPDKATLDQWILANPVQLVVALTRYEFRKLFTFAERVAIDSSPNNTAIPANYRAMLITLLKDLELSGEVQLWNPDVQAGIGLLEQLGLIGVGRSAQIISNTPPSA
jgi:hypothetical protein